MEKYINNLEVMKEYGFNYDYDRNCFIKGGYGALITNLTFKNAQELRKYVLSSPLYLSLLKQGYELVSGPAAPDINGVVYDSSAIYCRNYVDVDYKCSREELTEEKMDVIVSSIYICCRNFETLLNENLNREERKKDLTVAGKNFKYVVNNLVKDYSYVDLYKIVKAMENFYDDNDVIGKKYAESNIIRPIKEYIYCHIVSIERLTLEEKQEKDIKVARFVEEIDKISESYSRGMLIHRNERNIVVADVVDRINSGLTAREVSSVVSELRKSYREKPLITKIRIANVINDSIIDRTINEYYSKTNNIGVKQFSKK